MDLARCAAIGRAGPRGKLWLAGSGVTASALNPAGRDALQAAVSPWCLERRAPRPPARQGASRAGSAFAIGTILGRRRQALVARPLEQAVAALSSGGDLGSANQKSDRKKSKSWRQALAQARNSAAAGIISAAAVPGQSPSRLQGAPPDPWPMDSFRQHDVQQPRSAGVACEPLQQGRIARPGDVVVARPSRTLNTSGGAPPLPLARRRQPPNGRTEVARFPRSERCRTVCQQDITAEPPRTGFSFGSENYAVLENGVSKPSPPRAERGRHYPACLNYRHGAG